MRMAGKKRTTKADKQKALDDLTQNAQVPAVIQHEALPVPATPPRKELVLEGDPDAQLAFASKAAKALMTIVNQKPNPVMIRGKQYLEYGDWQVLARFYGATVEIEWTEPIYKDDDPKTQANVMGYEARALVKRNGEVISSAEGMCTRDENRWKDADDYAIKSMAQTRTAAKALRNAFGWVAELAGYSATPAEEMPHDVKGSKNPSMKPYNVVTSSKQTIMKQLKTLGLELVSKKEYEDAVMELTGLTLEEKNYEAIIEKLNEKIAADPNLGFDSVIDEKDN